MGKGKTKPLPKKKALPISLGDLDVDKGWPSIDGLFKILDSWAKTQPAVGQHITSIEAYDVVNSILSDEMEMGGFRGSKNGTGKLKSLLSKKKLSEVEKDLDVYFDSLPRRYDFFFYTPQLSHLNLGFKQITSDFSTVECVSKDSTERIARIMAKRLGSAPEEHEEGIPYGFHFRVAASGFAKRKSSNSASALALRRFKHLFVGLLVEKKIKIGWSGSSWGDSDGFLYVVDRLTPSTVNKVEISESLRKLLATIRLPRKPGEQPPPVANTLSGLLAAKKGTSENFEQPISSGLKVLLDYSISGDEVECIRTSAEWLFDAKLNQDDISLKVMQIAASAEAVLAEGKKIEHVTKTLSDRCAYLLGYNAHQRADIRQGFTKFYNVRSSLVHGRSRQLTSEDKDVVLWAEYTVEAIIRRELRYLAKGE
jgi:hypothetical protein